MSDGYALLIIFQLGVLLTWLALHMLWKPVKEADTSRAPERAAKSARSLGALAVMREAAMRYRTDLTLRIENARSASEAFFYGAMLTENDCLIAVIDKRQRELREELGA